MDYVYDVLLYSSKRFLSSRRWFSSVSAMSRRGTGIAVGGSFLKNYSYSVYGPEEVGLVMKRLDVSGCRSI